MSKTADNLPTPTLITVVVEDALTATAVPTEAATATEALPETVPATAVPPTSTLIPPTLAPLPGPSDVEFLRQELQMIAFPEGVYEGSYAFPTAPR